MKKFKVLFMLVLLSGFLMSAGGVYAYTYSGEWWITSNDGEASAEWGTDWTDTELGVYKDGAYVKILDPAAGGDYYAAFKVTDDGSGNYTLTIYDKGGNTIGTLDLGTTETFYFYMGDTTGTSYEVASLENTNYEISNGTAGALLIDFANNVPIPPSALLLGSGVIGLIGFGIRRRRASGQ